MTEGAEFLARGSYQRQVTSWTSDTLVADTEQEYPAMLSDVINAATEDTMFSWIRLQWSITATDEVTAYEWFVLKCQATDALQDMSDASVVERLQRDKRIIARGLQVCPAQSAGGMRVNKLELFKLELVRGEELRLVLRPMLTNTANHVKDIAVLEWRQVGA